MKKAKNFGQKFGKNYTSSPSNAIKLNAFYNNGYNDRYQKQHLHCTHVLYAVPLTQFYILDSQN